MTESHDGVRFAMRSAGRARQPSAPVASSRTGVRVPFLAWLAGVVLYCAMATAGAQVALESVDNAVLAGSGPSGNGPSTAAQVITLRHNTNNPGGNTMVARTPAIMVTFNLANQRFTGLTPAQLYTAGTGGNGVFFGASPTNVGGGGPLARALYSNFTAGVGASTMYTSVGAAAGQGLDLIANAGLHIAVSSNAITLLAPNTPTTARVRMADLVLTFSAPVTNPVLHFAGLGALTSSLVGDPTALGITTEYDLITPGLSFTRLSGNGSFAASLTQVTNSETKPSASCATNVGACGSVRVNGTAITTLTLRVYLRGDGSLNTWSGEPGSFNLDGSLIGVSLNEPPATVTVRKVTEGGTGTFDFTGTNGYTATAVTTSVAGTPVAGATRTLTAVNSATTITEAATAGYRLSSVACTGLGSGGTATATYTNNATTAGSVLLNAAATAPGSNIVCTFTNQRIPVIRLQKALPHGRAVAGNQFTLSMTGTGAPAAVTTDGTGSTASGTVTHSTPTIGNSYTLSETAAGTPTTVLSNYRTTYSCTNALAGGQTPSGSGTSFSVTPVAGDDLTCTFSNALPTRLTLVKTVTNDNGGTQLPTAWTLSAAGPTTISGATGSEAVTNATVNPGTYTLSESATPTGYIAGSYSCVRNGGAAVSGNSITLAAGDTATCTINNNDSNQTNLSITKTASADTAVRGDEVVFTLVVRNLGIAAAHGAVVRDPSVAGLDCTAADLSAPTCSATDGATCPTPLTATGLQSGVAVPALPNGGAVTIGLTCRVTASGLP